MATQFYCADSSQNWPADCPSVNPLWGDFITTIMEDDEEFVIEVRNLDDNSTIKYSAGKAADIPYDSIVRNEELTGSIWASYWSEVKQIEEEMWDAVQSGSLEKLVEIF